ncbi:hypothetical protein ACSSUQ_004247 [Yersinia enterocolitica]
MKTKDYLKNRKILIDLKAKRGADENKKLKYSIAIFFICIFNVICISGLLTCFEITNNIKSIEYFICITLLLTFFMFKKEVFYIFKRV